MPRDKNREFSSNTKKTLAERAGYICSNPACNALTIGPDGKGIFNCGEATHINV